MAWEQNERTGIRIPSLTEMNEGELSKWMEWFVFEVRKKDGTKFQSLSLNHVVVGVMHHLRLNCKPELDFYKDVALLISGRCWVQKWNSWNQLEKQAEPISVEEEERLWTLGFLGDYSPQALVDTMLFYNSLYFASRSGGEHRQLWRNPCQIELIERSDELPYLHYTEDISEKNCPGGLKDSRVSSEVIVHHANKHYPTHYFV